MALCDNSAVTSRMSVGGGLQLTGGAVTAAASCISTTCRCCRSNRDVTEEPSQGPFYRGGQEAGAN